MQPWFEKKTVVTHRRPISRWLAIMSGLLLFACLCWAGFQTGINRAQQVGIDMATSIETLNAEVKTLSNTLEETQQALVASELQRTTLTERLEALTPQLEQYRASIQTLEDQQLYYENLLSISETGSEVVVESAEMTRGPNGEWRFWALITQSTAQGRLTRGVLRLTYEYAEQGVDEPGRTQALVDEVPFEFVYFKRFEGNAPLPKEALVQSATISIEIDGRIVASQAFTSLGS